MSEVPSAKELEAQYNHNPLVELCEDPLVAKSIYGKNKLGSKGNLELGQTFTLPAGTLLYPSVQFHGGGTFVRLRGDTVVRIAQKANLGQVSVTLPNDVSYYCAIGCLNGRLPLEEAVDRTREVLESNIEIQ